MKDNGRIDMPPITSGEYLIGYLYEIGPTMAAGMGNGPVAFSEIQAWQQLSGIALTPWEARTLRRLSNDYACESHAATKADCPPPYGESRAAMNLREAELQKKMDLFLS